MAKEGTEALQAKINELEAAMASEKSISEGHQVEKEILKEDNDKLRVENESLKKEIETLLKGDAAAAKEKKSGVGETFSIGDDEYQVLVAAAVIPGFGRLTALEILASPEAQEKLVAINSGVIKKKN